MEPVKESEPMIRPGLSALLAVVMAVLFSMGETRTSVVHALGILGTCQSFAAADASAYDGSSPASAAGSVSASDYTLDGCVGLGQTNAIFQAGRACENAGIPAGLVHGLGYAVVTWSVTWSNVDNFVIAGPGAPQQFDCGDTFGS